MIDIQVLRVLNPDLILARDIHYGSQVWSSCKLRKERENCCVCERKLKRGEKVFRPITNAINRTRRMCGECAGGKT